MKIKQTVAILFFAIALGTMAWWFANGHHPWTTTRSMIEVKTTDELFGTTVTTQKWVDQFTPGLEWTGPIAGVLTLVGVWLLISAKRQTRPKSVA